jgi:hypothetical protein
MFSTLVPYHFSGHATSQARKRGISEQMIDQIICYGDEYWAGNGAHAYYLGTRAINSAIQKDYFSREEKILLYSALQGSVVISNTVIITVMHATQPPKHWRRS